MEYKRNMDVLRITQNIRCRLTPLPFGRLLLSVATSVTLGTISKIRAGFVNSAARYAKLLANHAGGGS